MTEQTTTELPSITRSEPKGTRHDLANQGALNRVNEMMVGKQDVVGLATYLSEVAGKPRGTQGGNTDLNSHFEEYIVRKDRKIQVVSLADLQSQLASAGMNVELLGVESIGNPNQKVSASRPGSKQG